MSTADHPFACHVVQTDYMTKYTG